MDWLSAHEWTSILLTIKLAAITTFILLLIGTPLAWWLSQTSNRSKSFIEAIVALPLVLPPTVLGFYLLVALSPNSPVGQLLSQLGITQLAFSFRGLVLGSVIYSMPFVVQPLQNVFSQLDSNKLAMAATLGASPVDRFINLVLPLSKSGFVTAIILGFAHTLGEFGVVLMLGGNIPGETQVVSILIYEQVETLNFAKAHWLSAGLLVFSFLVLLLIYRFNLTNVGWGKR